MRALPLMVEFRTVEFSTVAAPLSRELSMVEYDTRAAPLTDERMRAEVATDEAPLTDLPSSSTSPDMVELPFTVAPLIRRVLPPMAALPHTVESADTNTEGSTFAFAETTPPPFACGAVGWPPHTARSEL